MFSRAIPVVMYHHVSPAGRELNVLPEVFEDHLRVLKQQGWRTLNGTEFLAVLQEGKMPRKCVLLTFDDGFADNYVYAYPLLKKYDMKAMIFVATSFVEDCDIDRRNFVPMAHKKSWSMAFTDQRVAAICTWKELQEMDAEGCIDIQCHGHSHRIPEFIKTGDYAAVTADIVKGRYLLEQRLSKKVTHLAWPKGAYDAQCLRVATDAGFTATYTTLRGTNTGDNMLELKRLPAKNRDGRWLAIKLRIYASELLTSFYLAVRKE